MQRIRLNAGIELPRSPNQNVEVAHAAAESRWVQAVDLMRSADLRLVRILVNKRKDFATFSISKKVYHGNL